MALIEHVCLCMRFCICVHIRLRLHACVCVRVHLDVRLPVCIWVCAYVHARLRRACVLHVELCACAWLVCVRERVVVERGESMRVEMALLLRACCVCCVCVCAPCAICV
jgi:hypothetical protein